MILNLDAKQILHLRKYHGPDTMGIEDPSGESYNEGCSKKQPEYIKMEAIKIKPVKCGYCCWSRFITKEKRVGLLRRQDIIRNGI